MAVSPREGETFEELSRRLKSGVEAAGVLREYRRKRRFKPAHADRLRAAVGAAIALGQAADEDDGGMLRRALRFLGCWTLLSVLVGLALARVFRKLRDDGEG